MTAEVLHYFISLLLLPARSMQIQEWFLLLLAWIEETCSECPWLEVPPIEISKLLYPSLDRLDGYLQLDPSFAAYLKHWLRRGSR
jgi:hypothetical protein